MLLAASSSSYFITSTSGHAAMQWLGSIQKAKTLLSLHKKRKKNPIFNQIKKMIQLTSQPRGQQCWPRKKPALRPDVKSAQQILLGMLRSR